MNFWGPDGLILGLGYDSKTVLESTHEVEQLQFCMFLLILIFDFDLILGSFLKFWGPNGPVSGVGVGFKNFFGVS